MALQLCQLDSLGAYRQECKATVVSCTETASAPSGGKKKKKGAKDDKKVFEVEFQDATVLFPEGGGQPPDFGVLVYQEDNQDVVVPVLNCQRGKDKIVRVSTHSPIPVDTELQVKVDWPRRYDHMQHHTAQHLISAIALQKFEWPTTSWWLAGGDEPCQIDLDLAKEGKSEELQEEDIKNKMREVEDAVNECIRNAVPVNVHTFANLQEAAEHPLFRLGNRPVPERMEGILRVMEIEKVDFNKCCGTHLKNLSEMQVVHFVRHEKSKKGTVKLYFVTGSRAIRHAANLTEITRQLTTTLGTGPENFSNLVTKIMTEAKASRKLLEKANKELAEIEAAKITGQLKENTEKHFFSLHRKDGNKDFLDAIEKALLTDETYCTRKPLVLLTAEDQGKGFFLLIGPADDVTKVGKPVAEAMAGKGGGPKGRFQGSGSIDLRETAVKRVLELL